MEKELIERLAQAAGYEVDEFAIRNPRGHVAEDEREFLERFAAMVAYVCANTGRLAQLENRLVDNAIRAVFPMPPEPACQHKDTRSVAEGEILFRCNICGAGKNQMGEWCQPQKGELP